jgi:acetyl-CoA carboxylase, biotin carboxylase subunit
LLLSLRGGERVNGRRVLRRILVANRGEIAVRVILTCRKLGVETVLTASDADAESLPARLADRVIRIGPAAATASYLDVDAVVGAAVVAGVDAVYPGYGFLSENARLARACAAAGVVFIGPEPTTLAATGDKLAARAHAIAAGLPVLPGGHVSAGHGDRDPDDATDTGGPVAEGGTVVHGSTGAEGGAVAAGGTAAAASVVAGRIGFPVLVKAAGGGGGRGLRVVRDPGELEQAVAVASAEARAAFGDPRVYLERYVERGRHVEVQILGDGERVVHLGDRDCSVQRRYQKLVEEAPAPGLGDDLRQRLRAAAVALGRRLGYRGAGTVEFLVDADSIDSGRPEFYFLEVNARIQVEHPVTEAITGIDIVAEQLAIAEGRPLRVAQEDVTFTGHAIEVRLNAEDPGHDFQPSPGTITRAVFPSGPGVRVDTHVQAGATVPPYYDSLLAKVIAQAADRDGALATLRAALDRCAVEGVTTNLDMHRALLADPEFAAGGVDTGYLVRWLTGARSGARSRGHSVHG